MSTVDRRRDEVRTAPLTVDDIAGVIAAVEASRELLGPWMSHPTDTASWERKVAGLGDRNLSWVIHHADGPAGLVNANEIVRGPFLSTYLGYNAFSPFAGRGLLRAGLAQVLDELFTPGDDGGVGLHRAEANIQPGNARSIALVRGLGFRQEGFSPRYLFIDGAWRDHERWAVLADEWVVETPPHRR